jgi:hypothetical protein
MPRLSSAPCRVFVMLAGGLLTGLVPARASSIFPDATTYAHWENGLTFVTGAGLCAQSSTGGIDNVTLSLFPFAGAYSLLQSEDVGNGNGSTPEPGTLALICCCGAFLLLARRHIHLR